MADQRVSTAPDAPPEVASGPVPTSTGARRTGRLTPYLFMAPFLLLFSTFIIAPALYGVWISLHDWDYLLPGKPFVGIANYAALIDSASTTFEFFWRSMKATAIFTLVSVPPLVVLPLGVAMLLNKKFPGRSFFRAIYFTPYVLGVAVVGVLWRFLLDTNIGLLNYYLGKLGLPDKIPWITSLPWAWVSLVIMTVWWTLGFNAIIYLAGLQDISAELYDAAKVDGASKWQEFMNVTLPGLRPVSLFVITVTILASANMFGQSYLVTQGAPDNETRTAIMYIADEGLRSFNMGNAAAMSYVLAVFLGIVSLLNFRLFRQKD